MEPYKIRSSNRRSKNFWWLLVISVIGIFTVVWWVLVLTGTITE